MRFGRVSSSNCRPTGSFFGSTRWASRPAMPSTKRTVAYLPTATLIPCSILISVGSLIEARYITVDSEAAVAAGRP